MPPYDVLFVDLAAADPIPGLSCPPHEFLTTSALTTMNNVLSASGKFLYLCDGRLLVVLISVSCVVSSFPFSGAVVYSVICIYLCFVYVYLQVYWR